MAKRTKTVGDVVKEMLKMPQDIPVFVEGMYQDEDGVFRFGNLEIDFVAHHYHEATDEYKEINECILMLKQ